MTNEWFRILKSRNRSVSRANLKEFRRITRPVIQEFVDNFVEDKPRFDRKVLNNSLNTFLDGEGRNKIDSLSELNKFNPTHRRNLLSVNQKNGNYLLMASAMVREKGYTIGRSRKGIYVMEEE